MRITEPQMFRAVVAVGIAMVPVILLAAIVDPIAGAILFGIEAVAAIAYLITRVRSARRVPAKAEAAGGGSAQPPPESPDDAPEPAEPPPADSRR
ncbi:MAG: hypothetical protein M3331_00860 [Actinomycetota bacterium]|nr:hypothetical protein [Actinomycetota bacterium]